MPKRRFVRVRAVGLAPLPSVGLLWLWGRWVALQLHITLSGHICTSRPQSKHLYNFYVIFGDWNNLELWILWVMQLNFSKYMWEKCAAQSLAIVCMCKNLLLTEAINALLNMPVFFATNGHPLLSCIPLFKCIIMEKMPFFTHVHFDYGLGILNKSYFTIH